MLNKKHIQEGLDHKNLREITSKYNSNHRKDRNELIQALKKKVDRIFIDGKLAIKVIMNCRTISTHKFRTSLRFKQYNALLSKEKSVLTKFFIQRRKYANTI